MKDEQIAHQIDTMPYRELAERFKRDPLGIMNAASEHGMSTGQYLNRTSPETLAEQHRSVTERLLQEENLFLHESPVALPSTVEEFTRSAHTHALMYDYLYNIASSFKRRIQRHVARRQQRTAWTMPSAAVPDTPTNQAVTGSVTVDTPLGLSLDPTQLVASTHSIRAATYQPFRWVYDSDEMERAQVNPGTPLPVATMGQSEGNIRMAKYGIRFKFPYEVLRINEVRVNKIASMIELEALTEEHRLFAELIGILEDGDGRTGTAAPVDNQSAYATTVTNGTLSATAFSNWIDQSFEHPYYPTHVLMLTDAIRDLKEGIAGASGRLIWEQLATMGLGAELSRMDMYPMRIRFGRAPASSITANRLIALDANFAVEMVSQTGSDIREQARMISDQTEEMTISNTYLWAILNEGAVRVLNYNA